MTDCSRVKVVDNENQALQGKHSSFAFTAFLLPNATPGTRSGPEYYCIDKNATRDTQLDMKIGETTIKVQPPEYDEEE